MSDETKFAKFSFSNKDKKVTSVVGAILGACEESDIDDGEMLAIMSDMLCESMVLCKIESIETIYGTLMLVTNDKH